MTKHLAIFSQEAIERILSGEKMVEGRFSQRRIEPFGRVGVGDIVYIKPPGKEIVGQFRVKKVWSFEGLDEENWKLVKTRLEEDDKYFKAHLNARFGTLIFIDQVEQFITSPVKIPKKDLRGWVVLD